MAIFGKNRKEKFGVISAPVSQSTLTLDEQFSQYNTHANSAVSLHPSWNATSQRPSSSGGRPQQPALGQDYLAPSNPHRHKKHSHSLSRLKFSSMTNLLAGDASEKSSQRPQTFEYGYPAHQQQEGMAEGLGLRDIISAKFNSLVTSIDGERGHGDEAGLGISQSGLPLWEQQEAGYPSWEASGETSRGAVNKTKSKLEFAYGNYFSKVYLYANSRLPRNLPAMKLYLPTFPLLCLAAKYSDQVYEKPSGQEREMLVGADWKTGTKAMVVKSAPMDDMNLIVFAIRGTQTFMDWVANFNSAPASPEGFLDDVDNYCHSGFLSIARKMIQPLAARLRQMIEEFPERSAYSLLITGHSAGGAVAALLYAHMFSTSRQAESELNDLAGCFKRIHCVTFGAPPVSVMPLAKSDHPALRKSIFFSFLNEGDPIARAYPAYLKSLINLYTTPAPKTSLDESSSSGPSKSMLSGLGSKSSSSLAINKIRRPSAKKAHSAPPSNPAPLWPVPDSVFSNAGRLVLLRGVERKGTESKKKKKVEDKMDEGVVAQMITDAILREVIWGDPMLHTMRLYSRRIEVLATNAVTGRGRSK